MLLSDDDDMIDLEYVRRESLSYKAERPYSAGAQVVGDDSESDGEHSA